ncbi:MAG: histidine kinase [Tannerella sp.]|nr:histidine kinase [Tannerella sp.]
MLYLFCSLLLIGVISNCLGHTERALVEVLDIDNLGNEEVGVWRYFISSLFTFIVCNVAFFRSKMQEEAMNNEILSNEKKLLEMKVLKSQINTHFLHNALNNIYSMIYLGDKENAARYVMKLSQMLRYVLDDCETNHVPIAKEVAYIENYIDFQKARFETDRNIVFKYVRNNSEDIHIPPMIFQPLIENCFKHCPLQDENSFAYVEIVVGNRQIKFISENTQPAIKQSSDRNGGGIGIENLKGRLQLNFKDNYSLNVFDKDHIYRAELIINL